MTFNDVKKYREWADWIGENIPSTRYNIDIPNIGKIEIRDLTFLSDDDRALYKMRW